MVLLLVALVAQDTTIRSFLKTVEIASGKIETVYSADRRFEAPNWSRDGRYFLINSEGRLYRLTAGASQLAELPVSLATPRINNDHGISPDGKSLVISHEPTEDWLTSSVYTLPARGSTTDPTTRPTALSSITTPSAAGACRSGACGRTAASLSS